MAKHFPIRLRAEDTGAAADLAQLLAEVTRDGELSDGGILRLQQWLQANDGPQPAFASLRTTIDVLVATPISPAALLAIHKAIERVAPASVRDASQLARAARVALAKEKQREERIEQDLRERKEKARRRPQYSANFMVRGVGRSNRYVTIGRHLTIGQDVALVRELGNPHDESATLVCIPEGQLGYLPREYAGEVSNFLDSGYRQHARCSKILTAGAHPIPIVDVTFYLSDSGLGVETPPARQFVPEEEQIAASHSPAPGMGGVVLAACILCVIAVIVALVAAAH